MPSLSRLPNLTLLKVSVFSSSTNDEPPSSVNRNYKARNHSSCPPSPPWCSLEWLPWSCTLPPEWEGVSPPRGTFLEDRSRAPGSVSQQSPPYRRTELSQVYQCISIASVIVQQFSTIFIRVLGCWCCH